MIKEAVAIDRSNPFGAAALPYTLMSLGRINRFLGRINEEEKYQREAFQIATEHYGKGSPASIQLESMLAYCMVLTGKTQEGLALAEEALAAVRPRFPEANINLWTSLATATYAEDMAGDFQKAEKNARELVAIFGGCSRSQRYTMA